ncbi:MAG: carboxypeptidase regulatory-like domain-containing protein, partial [Delftia sp.]|nr:carboxypeptidase regulatory-like domain-containing protein [Delftia sp.]
MRHSSWVVGRFAAVVAVIVLLLAAAFGPGEFRSHTVRGLVTDGAEPIAGAVVRVKATAIETTTDAQGRFALRGVRNLERAVITAWKQDYYVGWAENLADTQAVEIVLQPFVTEDHPESGWLPSGREPEVFDACGNCHAVALHEWRQDAHSQTTRNPLVTTLYDGSDVHGNPGVGFGFLPDSGRADFPRTSGTCAVCHAPGLALDNPGADMNEAQGESANGVFCNLCHLIYAARPPASQSNMGVLSMEVRRPDAERQLFIGPYDDVDTGTDTRLDLQNKSQICAPCHMGSWWGVTAYNSFGEWFASPYREQGIECQDCHMRPD